jgi:monoterpene epsilon-lactone hydrolase
MASEQLRETAETMRLNPVFEADMSVEEQRAGMAAGVGAFELPADLTATEATIAGVACRWVDVPESRAGQIVLYLHGGGYALGSLDTHMELMARIARSCRCRVLGVDYRLAPEHPFPAALEDAVAVYDALLRESGDARLAIAGDSAGGGLTAASLLQIKAAGLAAPSAAVMFSPWTDLSCSGASYTTRAAQDPSLDAALAKTIATHYVGDNDSRHPLISPLFGDLTGLPPLLIQVGDHEVLLSDSVDFAERARDAGVTVKLELWDEAFHVFQAVPMVPEAHEALASMAGFLEQAWEAKA